MTANQATLSGSGNSENDGLQAYLGAIDVVYKDCVCKEGRHGADIASNLNFGPVTRCEFHNCEWDNTNSRMANGTKPAVGVHGQGSDTIYWNFTSNWGGPSVTGWKHDARWMVCGDLAAAGSSEMGIGDGAGDCCMRDFHLIRPANWFWTYEATVNVKRCHFENITRSQAPAGSSHSSRLVYATGADVNTFRNVDGSSSSWAEV